MSSNILGEVDFQYTDACIGQTVRFTMHKSVHLAKCHNAAPLDLSMLYRVEHLKISLANDEEFVQHIILYDVMPLRCHHGEICPTDTPRLLA